MLVNGEPIPVDEARAKEIMELEDFELQVELGIGEAEAKYWTCDFSYVSFFFPSCLLLSFLFCFILFFGIPIDMC